MVDVPRHRDGVRIAFRTVETADAEFIFALRSDPRYNAHLSSVQGDASDQRRWIEAYKNREKDGNEAYYVIVNKTNSTDCGVVRLYDITDGHFTWGSWILNDQKPAKAALDCAVMIYDLAFHEWKLEKSLFEVNTDNQAALSFHRRFGAEEIGEDPESVHFVISREAYLTRRASFIAALA